MGNTTTLMSLHHSFKCYEDSLCELLAGASREFLGSDLEFTLVSASYEPVFLWKDSDYFVTQINHTKDFPLVIKLSTNSDLKLLPRSDLNILIAPSCENGSRYGLVEVIAS